MELASNTVITDSITIESAFDDVRDIVASGPQIRNAARSIINNPQEIVNARNFAANNPHIARRAKDLTDPVKGNISKLANKEKKKLAVMYNTSLSQLTKTKTEIKVVRVTTGKGTLTTVFLPMDEYLVGWKQIQILDDFIVFYDPSYKKKNKKVMLLFDGNEDISVGGDAFICQVDEESNIINTDILSVKWIFEAIAEQKLLQ